MTVRVGEHKRKTSEVDISVRTEVDGEGIFEGSSGTSFMDHMLKTLTKHSGINIRVRAEGDLKHHLIEDLAIAIGKAMLSALGDKRGIARFGYAYVPMDDSLARAVVDLGGRAYSRIELGVKSEVIEDTKVEDIKHFLETLSQSLQCNMHIRVLYGSNDHHRIEAAIKALALAMRRSVERVGGGVPSTKGEI
ncbi:MAG: imidazoleglycerol-phosphate dehydratase [Candidatus Methanomethylicaceae archaeon]